MRVFCVGGCGGGGGGVKQFLAARGPPETGFEPGCGRGIVSPKFANFVKYRAPRTCKPSAKPAIPGVILLRHGLLWHERDQRPSALSSNGQKPLGMSNANAVKQLREVRNTKTRLCGTWGPRTAPPGEYGLGSGKNGHLARANGAIDGPYCQPGPVVQCV
jgi:hypothetical protein